MTVRELRPLGKALGTQAIGLDPTNAEAYLNRGKAYEGQHDYTRADADYDAADRLAPGKYDHP